ncbi:MAG: 2-oxoacid:acceptor oxidoreductase subunit alpha [Thermoplasmata archaeon]|jgi:2-oxoglutarate ferredoxin oxidoreductase subunit alpha|nr:2-oxoacid:acceptor oxidoreductase subunit alpha [Thermoplasmata archaeon]
MYELSVRSGGQAGDGIASVGETIARCFSRMGLHVFGLNAYQSVIRGGHVWYQARTGDGRPHSQGDGLDILYALDRQTVDVHAAGLRRGGTVVFDPEKFAVSASELPAGVTALPVPTLEFARKHTSQSILQNAGGIGATAFLSGIPLDILHQVLTDSFGRKAGDVVTWNLGASADGYHFAETHASANDHAVRKAGAAKLLMTGNQAIALGAAAAGLKFLAQYPMTPASGVLHYLAAHAQDFGIVVKQAEDEIAAINMAIGASFGGVRAMTATSGGGFSLMVEALGMAGMTETPLVVVESQRSGPSTGLPTKTEQGDLNLMLGAGQGEFPRAILAPTHAKDAYHATIRAFELAEAWQTPILLASDLHLSESHFTVDRDEIPLDLEPSSLFAVQPNGHEYLRYRYTDSGVSPRALPGQAGLQFIAGSDEHDEKGHLVSDTKSGIPRWVAERTRMMDKRMGKLKGLLANSEPLVWEGPADAPLTFVAWGSTVGPIRDAMAQLAAQGHPTNLLYFPTVYPLDPSAVTLAFGRAHRTLLVEANYSGQFGRLLRAESGVHLTSRLLKYDGEPFYPHEIVARGLEEMNHGG